MKLRDKLTALGWAKLAGYALVTFVVVVVLWMIVYRLFFQAGDLAREHGNRIVAEEGAKAATAAGEAATDGVVRRYEYHRQVDHIVVRGQKGVNDAWQGENVGAGVDAAGANALCELHDSLCRATEQSKVQRDRP